MSRMERIGINQLCAGATRDMNECRSIVRRLHTEDEILERSPMSDAPRVNLRIGSSGVRTSARERSHIDVRIEVDASHDCSIRRRSYCAKPVPECLIVASTKDEGSAATCAHGGHRGRER